MSIMGIDFQPLLNWLMAAWLSLYAVIASVLGGIYDFCINLMFSFFRWAFAILADFVEWAVANLPDPCCFGEFYRVMQWFADMLNTGGGIMQWLSWMYSFIQFEFGLRIVLCAVLARFLLRRIALIN